MSEDDDTALATRRTTSRRTRPAAKKRIGGVRGKDNRLLTAFSEEGEQSFDTMGTRLAAKTQALQKRILKVLRGRPMSIPELAKVLNYDNSVGGLMRQMRLLVHTEQVRAFVEVPREKIQRLAFVLSEEAPSGIWNRDPLRGFECDNPDRMELPGVEAPAKPASPRRKLALDLLKQAAALPKRQEALALEMTRQAMKALLEEDSK